MSKVEESMTIESFLKIALKEVKYVDTCYKNDIAYIFSDSMWEEEDEERQPVIITNEGVIYKNISSFLSDYPKSISFEDRVDITGLIKRRKRRK